jgi:hypothetical protein
MEWLTEKRVLATRDINSNNAAQTEELIEKQEKVLDILDKKRKVGFHQRYTEITYDVLLLSVPQRNILTVLRETLTQYITFNRGGGRGVCTLVILQP